MNFMDKPVWRDVPVLEISQDEYETILEGEPLPEPPPKATRWEAAERAEFDGAGSSASSTPSSADVGEWPACSPQTAVGKLLVNSPASQLLTPDSSVDPVQPETPMEVGEHRVDEAEELLEVEEERVGDEEERPAARWCPLALRRLYVQLGHFPLAGFNTRFHVAAITHRMHTIVDSEREPDLKDFLRTDEATIWRTKEADRNTRHCLFATPGYAVRPDCDEVREMIAAHIGRLDHVRPKNSRLLEGGFLRSRAWKPAASSVFELEDEEPPTSRKPPPKKKAVKRKAARN